MRNAFQFLLLAIAERLTSKAYVLLFSIVAVLILYGAVEGESLFWLVASFVGARCAYLAVQIVGKQQNPGDWQDLGERNHRSRLEQTIECAGLLAFCLLTPSVWVLYTHEIASLHTYQSWPAVVVTLLGLILYLLPFAVSSPGAPLRHIWWGLPLLPAAMLLIAGIQLRHPYLNPVNPDHVKLAAERVLALDDGILAGRHYEWVTAYANMLDEHGSPDQAIRFYLDSLRLNPNQEDVRKRLAALSPEIGRNKYLSDTSAPNSPHDPYWVPGHMIAPLPRCELDKYMEEITRTTIVIMRAGKLISDSLVDAVGDVIARELDIPVCTVPQPIPLPPHTRVRGLVVGRQWEVYSLVDAVKDYTSPLPQAPLRFLILTSADIYKGEANFVFAVSWLNGAALVSIARFGDLVKEQHLVEYRTAKQSLSSIMKSFGVPASTDVNSVLSYAQSVEEHDRKGNRASAEAMVIFRENLRALDAEWNAYRSASLK
jgi:predicted Zn-dependent protease